MQLIRLFVLCSMLNLTSLFAADKSNRIIVNVDLGTEKISKHIYGHFAEHLGNCIYGGLMTGMAIPHDARISGPIIKQI